jgi:hypothetical protein
MLADSRLDKSIIVFALIAVLLLLIPSTAYSQTSQQGQHKKTMQNILSAEAYWVKEYEGGNVVEELYINVIESRTGIDIFAWKTESDLIENEFSFLSGHFFSTDTSLLSINNKLDSATLSPVLIEICSPGAGQQDENGDCIQAIETLNIQVQWTAVDEKTTVHGKDTERLDVNKVMQVFSSSSRGAVATGTINGDELGESSFAFLTRAKSLTIQVETSGQNANFGALGNKGILAANAFWDDTSLDSETARIFLRASKDASDGSVNVNLQVQFPERDQTLEGELNIAGNSRRGDNQVFRIDHKLGTAELAPVSITVCAFELGNECSDPSAEGRTTYTVQAIWDATAGPVMTHKLVDKLTFGEITLRIGENAVAMDGEATGSINGTNLGPSDSAALFHIVLIE